MWFVSSCYLLTVIEARFVRLDRFWYLSQGNYSGLVEDLGKGLFFNPFNSLNLINTRYPSCGVRWDQRHCGRSGSVLEEGGWGLCRVAHDPGVWPCQHLLQTRHNLLHHFFEKIITIDSIMFLKAKHWSLTPPDKVQVGGEFETWISKAARWSLWDWGVLSQTWYWLSLCMFGPHNCEFIILK